MLYEVITNFVVGTALGGRLASLDALALIWQASWLVQFVLLLLLILSVISWTIIAFKAVEEGIVPGGGVALVNAVSALDDVKLELVV